MTALATSPNLLPNLLQYPLPDTLGTGTSNSQAATTATATETQGTVLLFDIRGFTTYSEKLDSREVVTMLQTFMPRAFEPVAREGGWIANVMGDAGLAMFTDSPTHHEHHALRALRAASAIVLAARQFQDWLDEHFGRHDLPAFAVGIGVHSGPLMICRIDNQHWTPTTIIGDTVNIAQRLEKKSRDLGWSIVASAETASYAAGAFEFGSNAELKVRGREGYLEAVEVIGACAPEDITNNFGTLTRAHRLATLANAGLLLSLDTLYAAERLATGASRTGTLTESSSY